MNDLRDMLIHAANVIAACQLRVDQLTIAGGSPMRRQGLFIIAAYLRTTQAALQNAHSIAARL